MDKFSRMVASATIRNAKETDEVVKKLRRVIPKGTPSIREGDCLYCGQVVSIYPRPGGGTYRTQCRC